MKRKTYQRVMSLSETTIKNGYYVPVVSRIPGRFWRKILVTEKSNNKLKLTESTGRVFTANLFYIIGYR